MQIYIDIVDAIDTVGFSEAVREAVRRPVDIFDVSHIEKDSRIDREISETGVMIYQRH